uniref:Uncharacterized protein n=2 Tax=Anguilla anguilla TaxID=7936 RepID=A0A0E9T5W5_ANGAN
MLNSGPRLAVLDIQRKILLMNSSFFCYDCEVGAIRLQVKVPEEHFYCSLEQGLYRPKGVSYSTAMS